MPQTMTTTGTTKIGCANVTTKTTEQMKRLNADHHGNVVAAEASALKRTATNSTATATLKALSTLTTFTRERNRRAGKVVGSLAGRLELPPRGGGIFSLLDSKLIRIAMVALLTSVIFDNTVYATQRDTLQLSHTPNSITNAVATEKPPSNNITNTAARTSASNNEQSEEAAAAQQRPHEDSTAATIASSSTITTTGSSDAATLAATTTTTTSSRTTATTTEAGTVAAASISTPPSANKSKASAFSSGSLLKGAANAGDGGGAGGAGGKLQNINRNTIEFAAETDARNSGPYFDKAASKNVTALLGKTAYLNCRVRNLGNRTMLLQVSWVRHRDVHLLTVGRYTYTSDQRFRAIHQPQTEDWILQIKYPQHRDSGIYECQVSTTPHMSHHIHLTVVEPSTQIMGAPDLYIESGSTINLTCVIQNSPEPPAYIYWNHNNAIINYDSPRGGVTVITNKGPTTTSFLLIKSAKPSDSGQYQCNPSNAKSKSVTVHVLNGKYPAAIQRAAPTRHLQPHITGLCAFLSLCYSVWASYTRCCTA